MFRNTTHAMYECTNNTKADRKNQKNDKRKITCIIEIHR